MLTGSLTEYLTKLAETPAVAPRSGVTGSKWGAGLGALLGGGVGVLSGLFNNEEDENRWWSALKNGTIGAGIGAGVGGVTGFAAQNKHEGNDVGEAFSGLASDAWDSTKGYGRSLFTAEKGAAYVPPVATIGTLTPEQSKRLPAAASVVGGLTGGSTGLAVGGGLGALVGLLAKDEDEAWYKALLKGGLIGAGAGGGIGLAGGAGVGYLGGRGLQNQNDALYKKSYDEGFKEVIEKTAVITRLSATAIPALIAGLGGAAYGGLTAGEDENGWLQALKYGLGGAALGGLGGYGYSKGKEHQITGYQDKLVAEEADLKYNLKHGGLLSALAAPTALNFNKFTQLNQLGALHDATDWSRFTPKYTKK